MTTAADPVHLAPSGEVHVTLRGRPGPLVLPRPSFGQMKRLIREHGIYEDRMGEIRAVALAGADRLVGARGDEAISDANIDELARIRDESRAIADQGQADTEAAVVQWWASVFEILEVPNPPGEDDWPSQFMNASLPMLMVNHWRFVPLGPG